MRHVTDNLTDNAVSLDAVKKLVDYLNDFANGK
jgi:hemerythrin-like domain-containing protein